MMVHPVIGRHVSVIVTYVSSSKSNMEGVDVFTYSTQDTCNKDRFTNVPEYYLGVRNS